MAKGNGKIGKIFQLIIMIILYLEFFFNIFKTSEYGVYEENFLDVEDSEVLDQ